MVRVQASDHGMTADGGHGGSTPEEVDAVALFVRVEAPSKWLDLSWLRLQKSAASTSTEPLRAEQVDVACTISTVMGLPIPQESVGTILPAMLDALSPSAKLAALQVTSPMLLSVDRERNDASPCLLCLRHSWGPIQIRATRGRFVQANAAQLVGVLQRARTSPEVIRLLESYAALSSPSRSTDADAWAAFLASAKHTLGSTSTQHLLPAMLGAAVLCAAAALAWREQLAAAAPSSVDAAHPLDPATLLRVSTGMSSPRTSTFSPVETVERYLLYSFHGLHAARCVTHPRPAARARSSAHCGSC